MRIENRSAEIDRAVILFQLVGSFQNNGHLVGVLCKVELVILHSIALGEVNEANLVVGHSHIWIAGHATLQNCADYPASYVSKSVPFITKSYFNHPE